MRIQKAKFHFVGVGGIGMCGLAELLSSLGCQVTGSDAGENANTDRLKKLGITLYKGHAASQVGDADVVVYSSAIPQNNPEIAAARALQIPLIPRAEALAEIMRLKRGIAVAGTHGKTTTTSMVSSVFLAANMNPTIFVGGKLELINSTALLGNGEWIIAEADESDGSFHKLSPEIAIITNIDSDHMDHYKTFENLQKSFQDFSLKIPFYGVCIACGDDPHIVQIFEHFPKRKILYGFQKHNDLVVEGSLGKYKISKNENGSLSLIGEFELSIPGHHNALNAAASIAAGLSAGISFEDCCKGLSQFKGVDRRFHYKGEGQGVHVYDDYGHHPTEVRAVMQAFREKFPQNKLIVYFQPHRYSRTQHCWHEFMNCFNEADKLLIDEIYSAGESPIPGVTTERLLKEMKNNKASLFHRDASSIADLVSSLSKGDIFITLGAGDGWKLGLEVLKKLQT